MSCFWYFPSQIWPRINARRVNSHAEANEHIHSLDYEMWLKFIISPTLFLCHLCRCFFVHDSLSFLSYCLDVTRRREFWEMLILRVKKILKFYDQSFFSFPSFLNNSRYDDIRSPLPPSISQLSLYNSLYNSHSTPGLIEPLPLHHRPVPIPPSRSLVVGNDSHSSGEKILQNSTIVAWMLIMITITFTAYENLDDIPPRPRKSWHINI